MKHQMKLIALVLTIYTMCLTAGCSSGDMSVKRNSSSDELTQEEIAVLIDTYPDDEEMILAGDLYSYHKTLVSKMDIVKEYLDNKYSDNQLKITSCSPKWLFQDYWSFGLRDENERLYIVTLRENAIDKKLADDYYGEVLRERYDSCIEEITSSTGAQIKVFTNFVELLGTEVNGECSVEEFLEAAPKATKYTYIFVNNDSIEKDTAEDNECILNEEILDSHYEVYSINEEIERIINENKLYGCYMVYIVDESQWADVLEMYENASEFERYRFNYFGEQE